MCNEDTSTNAGKAKKYGRSQRTWMLNFYLPSLFSSLMGEKDREAPLDTESEYRLTEIRKAIRLKSNDEYVPCAEDYMTQYLNQDSVKKALHVKSDITWKDCSTVLRYATKDRHNDMSPIYNYLIDGKFGLNILVFSGDDDSGKWVWSIVVLVRSQPPV